MARTPVRGTARVGLSDGDARMRRIVSAAADATFNQGDGIQADKDGRWNVRVDPKGGLEVRSSGLAVKDSTVPPMMKRIQELSSSASTADIIAKINEILRELRRTRRMN
jgi:hypothetical protein